MRMDVHACQVIQRAADQLAREGKRVTGPAVAKIVVEEGGPRSVSTVTNYLHHLGLIGPARRPADPSPAMEGTPLPDAEPLARERDALHRQVDAVCDAAREAARKAAADSVAVMQNALHQESQARKAAEARLEEELETTKAMLEESEETAVRMEGLEERLRKSDADLARAKSDLADARARIAEMEQRARLDRAAIEEGRARIDDLLIDRDNLRSDLAALRADRAELLARQGGAATGSIRLSNSLEDLHEPAAEDGVAGGEPVSRRSTPLRAPSAVPPAKSTGRDAEAT